MGPVSKGPAPAGKAAFLWDESFLWGLVAWRALKANGLQFDLLRSSDIKKGALGEKYRLLFVPGGWASNKLKALGHEGAEAIRGFVNAGGNYFGICGGAGLATEEGIGLLPVGRKPLSERVPSLSGRIRARISSHQIWGNNETAGEFHIWWPSQFVVNGKNVRVLAEFDGPAKDTFSSDIKASDIKCWTPFEQSYGLNLDPAKMLGDPLVVEGECGHGRVLASLIHFDTPDDETGQAALKNIWRYLGGTVSDAPVKTEERSMASQTQTASLLQPLEKLLNFGLENALWTRRGWTLQWRRGVRGLEYATLHEVVKELASMTNDASDTAALEGLSHRLRMFCRKAKTLLAMEKAALSRGETLSFSKSSSADMKALREELFSGSKSHGGEFKKILDIADSLLYKKLK